MNEPKYDEDVVNLGYLKKAISGAEENIDKKYENVSKHYGSKPNTPYYKGDTWIDEKNNIYTCINTREIGSYNESDWVSESGAKEEAESKNKIYLTQPSNYSVGDMWILQSDSDHKAGKKGEILITIAGRKSYNENDWINMLSYGNISSINEVSNNLNKAINRIGIVEESIEDGLITTYYQETIPDSNCIGDLWYVTETIDSYIKGKIYRYDGTTWELLEDPEVTEAFEKANEARIVADGKIQSFYSEAEPTEDIGVGDLWIDISDKNKLYRYNGTNWVPVYDTRIDEVIENVELITERHVEISTDLGKIKSTVSETTTKVSSLEDTTLKNVEVQYALSSSSTEAPTSDWSTIAPEWQSEKYMWQKTISTYFNGRIIESEPTCIQGAKGERGLQGLQGDKGEQGIQGPKGDTGAKGDKGDTGATGSTGAKGEKGDKGDTGASGATTYFHIKYSPVENPTSSQMSETPNTYIGTYVDFTEEDSSDPTKYTWFQFKGSQGEKGEKGIAGTNGTNGKTSYLHIAYANNSSGTSGFSVSDSTNKTYIGQYTDFEENDSTDSTKYSWTKIKGDTGSAGKGVKSVTNTYQAGSSGTTAPTGTWSTSIPKTTADKPYLWTMTVTTYTDNTTSTAYAIGATPEGIVIGAKNVLLNSSFEKNFDKWNTQGAPEITIFDDKNCAHIQHTSLKNTKLVSQSVLDKLEPNTTYTISGWVRVEEGLEVGTTNPTIMYYIDGRYKKSEDETDVWYGYLSSSIYSAGNLGIWRYMTKTFTTDDKLKTASSCKFFVFTRDCIGDIYFYNLKLEKGNKATDWTPAPEDVENSIEGVQTDANEALTSANNAQTIADKAMTAVDQLSRIISELVTDANGTSMMTQTSKGWTFNMSSITDNIEALRSGLDTLNNNQGSTSDLLSQIRDLVNEIDKKTAYINIGTDDKGNPCIELGKADNDFKVRITNTAIDFMEGSTKIAYANNNTFYVEKMIVKNELQIGESLGFVLGIRANGNLGLVPISQ